MSQIVRAANAQQFPDGSSKPPAPRRQTNTSGSFRLHRENRPKHWRVWLDAGRPPPVRGHGCTGLSLLSQTTAKGQKATFTRMLFVPTEILKKGNSRVGKSHIPKFNLNGNFHCPDIKKSKHHCSPVARARQFILIQIKLHH